MAVELVARMLADVRDLRQERRRLRRDAREEPPGRGPRPARGPVAPVPGAQAAAGPARRSLSVRWVMAVAPRPPVAFAQPAGSPCSEGHRMPRLCETEGLTDIQEEILKSVRQFVETKIIPVATELEHADEYPQEIVDGLKELGIFGLMIPEEYGGLGESLLTYALVVEEIARGWMSVSRRHQHPLHRGLHADAARHRGAEAEVPAADGHRRGARLVLDVRAGRWAPTSRRSRPRPCRGRRRLRRSTARRCG